MVTRINTALQASALLLIVSMAAAGQVSMEAPASVKAGASFEIAWTGDAGPTDFITLVKKGTPEKQYDAYRYTKRGSPLKLDAPEVAGEYEIRFLAGNGYATRARRPIRIESVEASLDIPPSVDAGAEISIGWSGPANRRDFITVVKAGAPERSYNAYIYTNRGNPVKLRMPDEPGKYEIRYLTGAKYYTLASAPITVSGVEASLEAPAEAPGGEHVSVTWSGPDHHGDFISFVPKGAAERTYGNYAYTFRGNPVLVKAPDEPGEYELRYLTRQSYKTLASAPIRVTPPKNRPGRLRVVSSAQGVDLPAEAAVELILDASGSMLQRLDGKRRIDIAKQVLTRLVTDTIPAGTPFAMRVFGHRETDSCRTDLEAPLGSLDPVAVSGLIAKVQAKNLAKTPIAQSLELVGKDLASATGPRLVMLITDGEETCNGDPAQAIKKLRAAGMDVRINIVGFAIDDANLKQTFRHWATLGGGSYFDATGAEQLEQSVSQALQSAYEVRNAAGQVVAEGVVGGDPITLPPGVYDVATRSNPPRTLKGLTVKPDETAVGTLR